MCRFLLIMVEKVFDFHFSANFFHTIKIGGNAIKNNDLGEIFPSVSGVKSFFRSLSSKCFLFAFLVTNL